MHQSDPHLARITESRDKAVQLVKVITFNGECHGSFYSFEQNSMTHDTTALQACWTTAVLEYFL